MKTGLIFADYSYIAGLDFGRESSNHNFFSEDDIDVMVHMCGD